jgi:Helix-turn-helix domain
MTMAAPILPGCTVLPPMELATPATNNGEPKQRKRKTADRFAVLNAFIDLTAGELPRSEVMVWLVLYRDTKNGVAKTSQADIARRAGINVRTARRAIGRLRDHRLLYVVRHGGLRQGPTTYRVHPLGVSCTRASMSGC